MNPRLMFSALAVTASTLALSACGGGNQIQDPSTQPAQATSAPQTVYPPTAPDEPLIATTVIGYGNATVMSDGAVNGIAACEARTKEITYIYSKAAYSAPAPLTSCISPKDGLTRARFQCFKTESGAIACNRL